MNISNGKRLLNYCEALVAEITGERKELSKKQ